jgi:hypothetical protein
MVKHKKKQKSWYEKQDWIHRPYFARVTASKPNKKRTWFWGKPRWNAKKALIYAIEGK